MSLFSTTDSRATTDMILAVTSDGHSLLPSSNQLNKIVQQAHDFTGFGDVIETLNKRLHQSPLHTLKCLVVIDYLVRNGPEEAAHYYFNNISTLSDLVTSAPSDIEISTLGTSIRQTASKILEFLFLNAIFSRTSYPNRLSIDAISQTSRVPETTESIVDAQSESLTPLGDWVDKTVALGFFVPPPEQDQTIDMGEDIDSEPRYSPFDHWKRQDVVEKSAEISRGRQGQPLQELGMPPDTAENKRSADVGQGKDGYHTMYTGKKPIETEVSAVAAFTCGDTRYPSIHTQVIETKISQRPSNVGALRGQAFSSPSKTVQPGSRSRRCFSCYTTQSSLWRLSDLNPGKVVCRNCGTYERKHRRSRLPRFNKTYSSSDQDRPMSGSSENDEEGMFARQGTLQGTELDNEHEDLQSRKAHEEAMSQVFAATFEFQQAQENKALSMLDTKLKEPELYRRLLKCDNSDAEVILELCQVLLDSCDLTNHVRKQIVIVMQRLSAKTKSFPSYFFVQGPISLINEYAISSGSFGDVYKARLKNEVLCLKVLRANQSILQQIAKSFAKEAILWSQLSHPNVLPFYGLHIFRSQLSFVSPWAENGNIMEYLSKGGSDIIRIFLCLDTAIGVDYLHSKGVIHGDIKSANVLVDRSGRAYLTDFGLSNVNDPQIAHWTSQSSVASKGGSVRWQAPELHRAESDDGAEEFIIHNTEMSDVFAWGCLCYEIFTGRVPFYHLQRPTTVALKILSGQTPSRPDDDDPAWLNHGLKDATWQLMEYCWKFDPAARPKMSDVVSRLNLNRIAADIRPPPQWPAGSAMHFRCSNLETGSPDAHFKHTLEDLNSILSRLSGLPLV